MAVAEARNKNGAERSTLMPLLEYRVGMAANPKLLSVYDSLGLAGSNSQFALSGTPSMISTNTEPFGACDANALGPVATPKIRKTELSHFMSFSR